MILISDSTKMRYPAMTFKGHIVYSRTFSEVEKAADELLKFVETKNSDGNRAAIGFDVEWRPTFKKGFCLNWKFILFHHGQCNISQTNISSKNLTYPTG